MTIKFVESLIRSVIDNDYQSVIILIQQLIEEEKEKGHSKVVQRLKKLLNQIPTKDSSHLVTSSSGSFKRNTYIKVGNDNALYEILNSNTRLEETILEDDVKEQISNFLSEWENSEKLIKHGVLPSNKLLFFGEPGTGKTKLAYGLANKLNIPLILVRLDEIISSYLGKTGKNIREIFEIAKKERVIIFLDEIDTLAKQRDDSRELGELKRVVTVLLQNIDNFSPNSILIGATNHEGLLDKAIWRRFQVKIKLEIPTKAARVQLFKLYLNGFATEKNSELLAELTNGLNGSTIRDLSEAIQKSSILRGRNKVELIDILSAFKLINSNERKKIKKEKLYKLCSKLHVQGYNISEISSISGIPYSTLSDNIK